MKNSKNEKPIQIIVNGRATITIMTSAENPTDLAIGRLFTEHIIETCADINSVYTDEPQISIVTNNPFEILLSRKTVLAGCGSASSFLDSGKLGKITSNLSIQDSQLQKNAKSLPVTNWYSAALFSEEGMLLSTAEDLTSQNAADRIIGWGLTHNTDFSRTYLLFSGNIVAETVLKVIIAKIPLVATNAEITSASITAANNAELSLHQIIGNRIITLSKTNRCNCDY
ncbi:MAG TPA: formate dehydrogenase accessory sulfurtransferase FdhD [Methanocorpusculum sp.]|nr:formate dehydrogenase accessory sulfurtransferase FdhD [Methanocorpusculum sp.]